LYNALDTNEKSLLNEKHGLSTINLTDTPGNAFHYNWDTVVLSKTARFAEEGLFRPSNEIEDVHEAAVAVKANDGIVWKKLSTLSNDDLIKYREQITMSLSTMFKDTSTILNIQATRTTKNKAVNVLTELYEALEPDQKRALIRKHRRTFLGETKCVGCLKRCDPGSKKTCLANPNPADCGGLCHECYCKLDNVCTACDANLVNVMECPICLEVQPSHHSMCPSDSCQHGVCFSCYGRASRFGNPLVKCPLCRSDFIAPSHDEDFDKDVVYDDISSEEEEEEEEEDQDNNETSEILVAEICVTGQRVQCGSCRCTLAVPEGVLAENRFACSNCGAVLELPREDDVAVGESNLSFVDVVGVGIEMINIQ